MEKSTRLFQTGLTQTDPTVVLTDENVRIVRSVLRMESGDAVELVDGLGLVLSAKLVEVGKKKVVCEVTKSSVTKRMLPEITLLQGTPKGEKSSWVVQKAVEWGVRRIIFLESDHTVVKTSHGQKERWLRVAQEALRQSGNPFLPEIEGPIPIQESLNQYSAERSILFDEKARDQKLRDQFNGISPASVSVAVGPEGGWSDGERKLFTSAGFISAGFGPYVLRTETAALSAIAFVHALTA